MTLHIYGPYAHHDDVIIVGTADDLQRLHRLIRDVLFCGATDADAEAPQPFFANDGEGFGLTVCVETETGMDGYALPYSADYLRGDTDASPDWPRRAPAHPTP